MSEWPVTVHARTVGETVQEIGAGSVGAGPAGFILAIDPQPFDWESDNGINIRGDEHLLIATDCVVTIEGPHDRINVGGDE